MSNSSRVPQIPFTPQQRRALIRTVQHAYQTAEELGRCFGLTPSPVQPAHYQTARQKHRELLMTLRHLEVQFRQSFPPGVTRAVVTILDSSKRMAKSALQLPPARINIRRLYWMVIGLSLMGC